MTTTLERPADKKVAVIEDDNTAKLRQIIQFELRPILRRQHLNRDVITVLVGDRGSGKSIGSAAIGLMDYALQGEPIWSNMDIHMTFYVDAETAWKYGLKPGHVTFQSLPLDKDKLLDGDTQYANGVIVVEEINIWLADARRAMSNQNLAASDLVQMIRKLHSALIANCIHEMFIDNRIRDAVDNFISSEDRALFPDGLERRKPQGEEFQWKIFPMTRKLTGLKYSEGQPPVFATLKGKPWWGSFSTDMKQDRTKYHAHLEHDGSSMDSEMSVTEAPETTAYVNKWAWLETKALSLTEQLLSDGYPVVKGSKGPEIQIASGDLWNRLGVDRRMYSNTDFKHALEALQIWKIRLEKGGSSTWRVPTNSESLVE